MPHVHASHGALVIENVVMGTVNDSNQVVCRDHAIWLSLGGFQETSADAERLHNTHVVVDDVGEITAVYRKIHLFDVDVPNGPKLLESASTAPGVVPHRLLGYSVRLWR
jgi:predicted amidohydrolase